MGTFEEELEASMHKAFAEARNGKQKFMTVEHLLLVLLDNLSAVEVLRACGADIDVLRNSLTTFIKENAPSKDVDASMIAVSSTVDVQPTLSVERAVMRVMKHVRRANDSEKVTGANMLVGILLETDSYAAHRLQQQGVTLRDAVNFITHGIKKPGLHSPTP